MEPDQPMIEELDEIQIHPQFADHKVQIGAQLDPKSAIGDIRVYNQKNTDYSRKQILPFIKEILV